MTNELGYGRQRRSLVKVCGGLHQVVATTGSVIRALDVNAAGNRLQEKTQPSRARKTRVKTRMSFNRLPVMASLWCGRVRGALVGAQAAMAVDPVVTARMPMTTGTGAVARRHPASGHQARPTQAVDSAAVRAVIASSETPRVGSLIQ